MKNCRILTPNDKDLINPFLEIFFTRLKDISQFYTSAKIQEIKTQYTFNYVLNNLDESGEKRFVGYFNQGLQGILIETEDIIYENIPRTNINWVMSKQSRQGIGSILIQDAIERAKRKNKERVSLAVALKNKPARRLYEKMGFKPDIIFNQTMLLMNYFI